ncbi:hypothetical protein HELRODRAFT_86242 [Helobdella robusta]|uniref:Uncharacterized protein n=1 Tax=Helobdella robusta TaxID=6412 RepID=T1G691_HELRO|nr:hypothetical protein HELRODRAFT_86242 [Helobdella robusta]ESN95957.1 hypothetical protein HELRODRAFT_86242 [Helobdella robusta]
MSNSSLVIPVALWGKNPPTHSITCLLMTANQKHVVTGSNDGQLCVWDVDSDWTMSARMVLYGHSSTVTCLATMMITMVTTANDVIIIVVVIVVNREMCLWDISDGRCMESIKSNYIHTHLQV